MHALIIASGKGSYRPGIDNTTFTEIIQNATTSAVGGAKGAATPRRRGLLLKDSFTVFPLLAPSNDSIPAPAPVPAAATLPFLSPAGSGCGWQAVRIYTFNPGIWLLHCHIISHASMGMGIVLHVREKEEKEKQKESGMQFKPLPPLPNDAQICGDTGVLYREEGNLHALLPQVFAAPSTAAAPSCPDSNNNNNNNNNNAAACPPAASSSSPNSSLVALLVLLILLLVCSMLALFLLYRRFESLKRIPRNSGSHSGGHSNSDAAAQSTEAEQSRPQRLDEEDEAEHGNNHAGSGFDADPQEHLVVLQMMPTRPSRSSSIELAEAR